jgi:hypothetical protein
MACTPMSAMSEKLDVVQKANIGYDFGMATLHCELCGREKPLTKHHLIPRAVHTKKRFINRFGKEEMRQRGIQICKQCHSGIHDLIEEKELAENFSTKELLLADERIQKHIEWSRKQK